MSKVIILLIGYLLDSLVDSGVSVQVIIIIKLDILLPCGPRMSYLSTLNRTGNYYYYCDSKSMFSAFTLLLITASFEAAAGYLNPVMVIM